MQTEKGQLQAALEEANASLEQEENKNLRRLPDPPWQLWCVGPAVKTSWIVGRSLWRRNYLPPSLPPPGSRHKTIQEGGVESRWEEIAPFSSSCSGYQQVPSIFHLSVSGEELYVVNFCQPALMISQFEIVWPHGASIWLNPSQKCK